jgi:hypothetical protein
MRTVLKAGGLLAGTFLVSFGAGGAYAACLVPPTGNTQNGVTLFQCDSDNQATDADDLKYFLTKTGSAGVTSITGSLNKNTSAPGFQNIKAATDSVDGTATFIQQGSGFAELHSSDAGKTSNTMHDVVFTPITPGKEVKDGGGPGVDTPFLGFDGFIGRGQVDPLGGTGPIHDRTWDGIVTLEVDFKTIGLVDFTFMGDTSKDDIGAIGFDERDDQLSQLINSVTMHLDATGAWNEVKEFNFSTPGSIAAIPEPSTWAMLLLGLAGLGYASVRRGRRGRLQEIA